MTKKVIVVASGETERRALPYLVSHLRSKSVSVDEVRIPPNNATLNARMVERIIKSAWYEKRNTSQSPDKFVLVVDVDRRDPDVVLSPIEEQLHMRLDVIDADIQYAYAQEHLEAWYFADAGNLRRYIGRDLGHVDTSKPDEIRSPRNHLKNLLGTRFYSARRSEEIAKILNPEVIAQRSPSFRAFLDALLNGVRGGHE